jgi:hypothetical protein
MSTVASSRHLTDAFQHEWRTVYAERTFDFGPLGRRRAGDLAAELRSNLRAAQDHREEQDRSLHQLLVLARDGHKAAERLVLQLLVPQVLRVAHRVHPSIARYSDERVNVAMTAAWEVVTTYPLNRRSKVLANLQLEVLRLVTSSRPNDLDESSINVSDVTLEALAGEWVPDRVPEVELANFFAWAIDTRTATVEEVRLLSRCYLGDEGVDEVAKDLGVRYDALRQRLTRIRKRLSSAHEQMLADAA